MALLKYALFWGMEGSSHRIVSKTELFKFLKFANMIK